MTPKLRVIGNEEKSEWRPRTSAAYRAQHRIDPFWGEEDEHLHHPHPMGLPTPYTPAELAELAAEGHDVSTRTSERPEEREAKKKKSKKTEKSLLVLKAKAKTPLASKPGPPGRRPLDRLFGDLNQQFFRGRLPAYRIQFTRFGIPGKWGECDNDRRMIRLSRELKDDPAALRRWLLHEMCHIGSPGHGRRFQAKLARLAAAGESWAEPERRDFADRPRGYSLSAEIAQTIDDAVRDVPDVRWSRHVLQELGDRIGRSPRDTMRAAPWAPQRWERSRRRVLEDRDLQRRTIQARRSPRGDDPEDVRRRFVIHTDEGDIPVELTFDPTPLATPDRRAAGDRARLGRAFGPEPERVTSRQEPSVTPEGDSR